MKKPKNNHKILIVEDDEDFLYILKTKFESEGFEVSTAKNASDGITVAEEEKPSLILTDVLMPETSGIEMAQSLKKSGNKAFIIFMTNLKDVDYVKEIQTSEDFDCVIKSDTRISELVDKVKNKLGIK